MNQHIERQIELLGDAKNIFVQHSQELENLFQMLNNAIISLESDELNYDYVEYLHDCQVEYNAKIKSLIDLIETDFIIEIQQKIQYLEERE